MVVVKDIKGVHVRGNVTPIDVNVKHLAFCAIQNVTEACRVITKDNTLCIISRLGC